MKIEDRLYFIKVITMFSLIAVIIGFVIYFGLPKKDKIEQRTYPVSEFERGILERDFGDSVADINYDIMRVYMDELRVNPYTKHPNTLHLVNPYKFGNIVYRLESTYQDSTYTDYGNKEKIMMFKCKRYRELTLLKTFIDSKRDIMNKELDEINEKTCN